MPDPIRILYLDDDTGLGVLLSRALTPHGYAVHAVETGEDALAALVADRFDVVAMDHNLTNEVGLDLIPRIRAMPDAPPIIYVTGSEDVRIAVAALKAGAVDYVWKDVQGHYRDLLRQAVDTAVAQEKMKREREEAQREVAEARDRAEMLLKEVNHRIANSLAIVSALIQMQANATDDAAAKAVMHDTQARVSAIAGVHRRLYTSSDVRFVEVSAYLQSLVQELAASLNIGAQHLSFTPANPDVTISADKAVSLGVVVTELLTNAAKYAYDGAAGPIRVLVSRLGDARLEVAVEDDGVGWRGTGAIIGSGVGSRIIKAMAHSLQGELSYDPDYPGTRALLRMEI